jgi:hypothetical protein
VSIRLPTAVLERLEKLTRKLSADSQFPIKRADVLRAALMRGIEELESEAGAKRAKR